jgi:hypothetical protein
LPRATIDRPDDVTGPQIHVLYVLPSDGVDRALDTNGTLADSVANFQRWLWRQTKGRDLRIDTFQGATDVSFVRLGQTNAALRANGVYIRDAIERSLIADGFDAPGKLYAVYYDGSTTGVCGSAAWPPELVGTVGAVYMKAPDGAGGVCEHPALSRSGLQEMDLGMLHEVLHTMGFVPACAPHGTRAGSHVSDSPNDLMYAGRKPWTPSILDVGHNDYFEAHISGCLDLADSPYLVDAAPPSPSSVLCLTPTVIGMPLARARTTVAGAGCALGRITRALSGRRKGLVADQTPQPGSRLRRGQHMRLTVSLGRVRRRARVA